MVDVRKAAGDTLEYHKVSFHNYISLKKDTGRPKLHFIVCVALQFYKKFCGNLENIIWKPS